METRGAATFQASGDAYDRFMGRYSRPLATLFADAARVKHGQSALDVGCGPGALTTVLVDRLGADKVTAVDPSPPFLSAFRVRLPEVDVIQAAAESLPLADDCVDVTLAQLVLHFVSKPALAAAEMRRVTRPGGRVAACTWDFADGMQLLRLFWDSARALDDSAPDEARVLLFGRPGEIADLFDDAGLLRIEETTLTVSSEYADFGELWNSLKLRIGPAGAFVAGLSPTNQERLRAEMERRLGYPRKPFTMSATARCAVGAVPA